MGDSGDSEEVLRLVRTPRRRSSPGSPVIKRRRLADRTNRSTTPKNLKKNVAAAVCPTSSPGFNQLLSQDDSFFNEFAAQLAEESVAHGSDSPDMFEESDGEKSPRTQRTPRRTTQKTPRNTQKTPRNTQMTQTITNFSPPSSSLPLSCLDVGARVMEDLRAGLPAAGLPAAPAKALPQPRSRLLAEGRDVGPFHGLPAVVAELYRRHKGVRELFPWQARCLESPALRDKASLLYSLPTSSGKTLVAEIVMLQELVCYKKNVIFVLPYVSLVQEKVRAMAPFALELGFHLQEYAGSRGAYPPQKRIHKRDLYICTIEKAHALFNSLVAEGRRAEVGLIVVDEVHMVGEGGGRGASLETLLVKVKHTNQSVVDAGERLQLVAMSATVGNLVELSAFLQAELFTDDFRPVELKEHVVVGRDVMEVRGSGASRVEERFVFTRKVEEGDKEMKAVDEDGVVQLVLEVFPDHSVLVFCDSKKRCESVAELVVRGIQQRPELADQLRAVRREERAALLDSLHTQTAGFVCPTLRRTVGLGIAYHHSGLTQDERKVVEEGFLAGSLGVLCCTSTLAAGVNLPARRVILRSPYMGRAVLTHGQYKQMVGRAGRAGLDTHGESFLMLRPGSSTARLAQDIVLAPVEHCVSSLHKAGGRGLPDLLLNCLHLGLASTPGQLTELIGLSLLAAQATRLRVRPAGLAAEALQLLLTRGLVSPTEEDEATQQTVTATTVLRPSRLGRACVAGNLELSWAERLYRDLKEARPGLAVDTSLHLLFLITPYDMAEQMAYDVATYHQIFLGLSPPEAAVCRGLGVTEGVMVRLVCGSVPGTLRPVLSRLYCALMLLSLWGGRPVHAVAAAFQVPRGQLQSLMGGAASFASGVLHFCQELEEFWAYQDLLEPFARRLSSCASPELLPLLELPGVQAARARQLHSAGYTTVAELAKARPVELVTAIKNLSVKAAMAIVQGAKLVLTERVENLRDQAEAVILDMA